MRTDQELDEILAEIGRGHRTLNAPKSVEAVLSAATVGQKNTSGRRSLRPAWAWGFVVVLLVALVWSGTILELRRNQESRDRQVRSVPVPSGRVRSRPAPMVEPEQPSPSVQVAVQREAPSVSAPTRRAVAGSTRPRAASSKQLTGNSLEEFVPLPVSEGLPQATELSVVRVSLLGRDLEQFGLEAPADAATRTMLAEFVVGEDGLPRAIRIVQ